MRCCLDTLSLMCPTDQFLSLQIINSQNFQQRNGGTEHLLGAIKPLTGLGSLAGPVISAPIDAFVTLSPQKLPVFTCQINFPVSSILNSLLAKSAGMWGSEHISQGLIARNCQRKNQTIVSFAGQLNGNLRGNSLKIMSHTPRAEPRLAIGFAGTKRLSPNFSGKLPKAISFTKRPSF